MRKRFAKFVKVICFLLVLLNSSMALGLDPRKPFFTDCRDLFNISEGENLDKSSTIVDEDKLKILFRNIEFNYLPYPVISVDLISNSYETGIYVPAIVISPNEALLELNADIDISTVEKISYNNDTLNIVDSFNYKGSKVYLLSSVTSISISYGDLERDDGWRDGARSILTPYYMSQSENNSSNSDFPPQGSVVELYVKDKVYKGNILDRFMHLLYVIIMEAPETSVPYLKPYRRIGVAEYKIWVKKIISNSVYASVDYMKEIFSRKKDSSTISGKRAIVISSNLLLTIKSVVDPEFSEEIGIYKEDKLVEALGVYELDKNSEFVIIRFPEGTFDNTTFTQLGTLKDATSGLLVGNFKEKGKLKYIVKFDLNPITKLHDFELLQNNGSVSKKKDKARSVTDNTIDTYCRGCPLSQNGRVVGLYNGVKPIHSFAMFSDEEIRKIEEFVKDEARSK